MSFEKCKICGKYGFIDNHKCPPKWEVSVPEYDEDYWQEIYAFDEEEAAENMADHVDEDHDLFSDGEMIVVVRKPNTTEMKTFIVTAEPDIIYSATEQKVCKENVKNDM